MILADRQGVAMKLGRYNGATGAGIPGGHAAPSRLPITGPGQTAGNHATDATNADAGSTLVGFSRNHVGVAAARGRVWARGGR